MSSYYITIKTLVELPDREEACKIAYEICQELDGFCEVLSSDILDVEEA